jgi:hypothetical protein
MLKRLLLLLLISCGGAPELSTHSEPLTFATPELRFQRDWRIFQTGTLVSGMPLSVVYDDERLGACRSSQGGRPTWSVTAHWRLAGGAVTSQAISGLDPNGGGVAPGSLLITPPREGDLVLWFEATNVFGCDLWDSDFGRNFHFSVDGPPSGTIHFAADWSETVDGTVERGSPVIIDFDLDRTPSCRQTYNGLPTWEVLAEYRFDGGSVHQTPVTSVSNQSSRAEAAAIIGIPEEARELEIWFKNTDRAGCVLYDSNFSRNYRFSL